MTQDNQELIPILKPDFKAMKKLLQEFHDGHLDSTEYKEHRERLIEEGERIELPATKYNKIIQKLTDMLVADYTEGIFTEDEYKDEVDILEKWFFKESKPEKVEEKEGYIDGDIEYDPQTLVVKNLYSNPINRINMLERKGVNFLMKRTSETTQIILNNTQYVYTHSTAFPRHKLFLFVNVKKDVTKWLEDRKHVALPPHHEVSVYNYEYDDSHGEVCGTDLDHAYWRIAFTKGMITEKTYEFGLDPSCKALRLATISVLGREKSYYKYIKGKIDHKFVLREADPNLQSIYKYIRFFCYQMMFDLSKMLGDDFDCWQTDCIYYRRTPENVQMVHKFLKKRGLTFKQLEFFEAQDEEE